MPPDPPRYLAPSARVETTLEKCCIRPCPSSETTLCPPPPPPVFEGLLRPWTRHIKFQMCSFPCAGIGESLRMNPSWMKWWTTVHKIWRAAVWMWQAQWRSWILAVSTPSSYPWRDKELKAIASLTMHPASAECISKPSTINISWKTNWISWTR